VQPQKLAATDWQDDQSTNPSRPYGVHLNPNKSERISFTAADRVIVLAEE
jgi:hypothetical protein